MPRQPLAVCHLGRVAYEPAWALQRQVQARIIEAKRRTPPEPVPHVLLLVEHPPVAQVGVVVDHHHAVGGAAGVELHPIGPQLASEPERRQGVLGRGGGRASVGDDEGHGASLA